MTDDPFAQPSGSNYPKPEDLEGFLILLHPSKIESVPKRPEHGGGMQDRASADTTVFPSGDPKTGDIDVSNVEEYADMYWSQTVMVNACKQALKPGNRPFVLGVLKKVGTKESREKLKFGETAEDYTAARQAWVKAGGKGDGPKHVWILGEFDEKQAQAAREYIAGKQRASDPFVTAAPSAGE